MGKLCQPGLHSRKRAWAGAHPGLQSERVEVCLRLEARSPERSIWGEGMKPPQNGLPCRRAHNSTSCCHHGCKTLGHSGRLTALSCDGQNERADHGDTRGGNPADPDRAARSSTLACVEQVAKAVRGLVKWQDGASHSHHCQCIRQHALSAWNRLRLHARCGTPSLSADNTTRGGGV